MYQNKILWESISYWEKVSHVLGERVEGKERR